MKKVLVLFLCVIILYSCGESDQTPDPCGQIECGAFWIVIGDQDCNLIRQVGADCEKYNKIILDNGELEYCKEITFEQSGEQMTGTFLGIEEFTSPLDEIPCLTNP